MIRMVACAFLIALAQMPVPAKPLLAQATKAAIGTAVGVGGGAVITMSIVVARARFEGRYLESVDDLIHWQSVPMILTPAVGLFFGLGGVKPLNASIIGSVSGMAIGSAVGAGIGWIAASDQEAPWAGGVIGAGAGMVVGGLFLGGRAWLESRKDDEPGAGTEPARIEFRLPI
jgi:hypothetical protein